MKGQMTDRQLTVASTLFAYFLAPLAFAFIFWGELGIEPRASCMLSTPKLQLQLPGFI
jgi:hypothetical protein